MLLGQMLRRDMLLLQVRDRLRVGVRLTSALQSSQKSSRSCLHVVWGFKAIADESIWNSGQAVLYMTWPVMVKMVCGVLLGMRLLTEHCGVHLLLCCMARGSQTYSMRIGLDSFVWSRPDVVIAI